MTHFLGLKLQTTESWLHVHQTQKFVSRPGYQNKSHKQKEHNQNLTLLTSRCNITVSHSEQSDADEVTADMKL